MKQLRYLLSFGLLLTLFFAAGCGGGGEPSGPTIEEQQKDALAGTWVTTSGSDVKLDGTDAPGDWSGFSITFTKQNTVSVSGDDPTNEVDIFDVSTYTIMGSNVNAFTLQFNGDANETADVSINGNSMVMTFSLAEGDKLGAKVLSVEGNWTFNLTKQ